MKTVLCVNSSMRLENSQSRALAEMLLNHLREHEDLVVIDRDLRKDVSFINESWINANFTDKSGRSSDQHAILKDSDELIAELRSADILVLAVPVYNFGVPAALKAWIDQVCRARETFKYTPSGPIGLLEGKKAYLIVTSGGTKMSSPIDFATPYLRHVLSFIGIKDVTNIDATTLMSDTDEKISEAKRQISSTIL